MKKALKLKRLIGAVVCFKVDTPFSSEGEATQIVSLRIDKVYRAKCNNEEYVQGVALHRLKEVESSESGEVTPEFRQYQIKRIYNRSMTIIVDNGWSLKIPHLKRLTTHDDSYNRRLRTRNAVNQ